VKGGERQKNNGWFQEYWSCNLSWSSRNYIGYVEPQRSEIVQESEIVLSQRMTMTAPMFKFTKRPGPSLNCAQPVFSRDPEWLQEAITMHSDVAVFTH
jgi:hypothetical protein